MTTMLRYATFMAFVAILSLGARAQRLERALNTHAHAKFLGVGSNTHDVEWTINEVGQLSYTQDTQWDFANATSLVAVPGSLHVLSATEILIGGRDAGGSGLIEHWRVVPGGALPTLVQVSALSLPRADVAGLAYSSTTGRLYVLDCKAKKVFRGQWSPRSSLSTVSLSTFVGTTDVPDLDEADQRHLALKSDGTNPTLALIGWPFTTNQLAVVVSDLGTAFTLGSYHVSSVGPDYDVFLDDTSVTEAATSVKVFAPPATTVQVVDGDTGAVLGSAVTGSTGEVVVALNAALVLDHRYCARRTGDPTPYDLGAICVRRYGFPETFADGTTIDPVHFQYGAQIGAQFWMEVGMQHTPKPTSDLTYDGMLLIAFRQGGSDPVVPYGSNLLLAAPFYTPAKGVVTAINGWGLAFSVIDIPNDPGLVGLVFLTQFAMQDGQDYRLSHIYASVIKGDETAQMTSAVGTEEGRLIRAALHASTGLQLGRVFDAGFGLTQILSRR